MSHRSWNSGSRVVRLSRMRPWVRKPAATAARLREMSMGAWFHAGARTSAGSAELASRHQVRRLGGGALEWPGERALAGAARQDRVECRRDGTRPGPTSRCCPRARRSRPRSCPGLSDVEFAQVLTSPMLRARRTAELAGFPDAVVDPDLAEWGYGEYEGITTPEIREHRSRLDDLDAPGARRRAGRGRCRSGSTAWSPGRGPSTARPSPSVTGTRCARSPPAGSASPVTEGRHFQLDTATVSVLGWEHESPTMRRWNA